MSYTVVNLERSSEERLRDSKEAARMGQTMKSRFFFAPSFDIYGGKAGLFDLGPPMAAFQQNLFLEWRRHFIEADRMLEVDCTNVVPYVVLKHSGHVDRFCDIAVKDSVTGDIYRADKFIETFVSSELEKPETTEEKANKLKSLSIRADSLTCEEMDGAIKEFGIKSGKGNDFDKAEPFNLMFPTTIGVTGKGGAAFMRPEIAQGIFMNFLRCYEYNNQKLPFASAQVGRAFRNEIAPKGGLFRLIEFSLAEVEHYYDPTDQSHPKFGSVADLKVNLWPRELQEAGDQSILNITLREAHTLPPPSPFTTTTTTTTPAISSSSSSSSSSFSSPSCSGSPIIANQTLAYFLGRTFLYLTKCGIRPELLRFRQHLRKQMAHYARDCWDAEAFTRSEGWVEIVGIADRSCYDLEAHSKGSGVSMTARRVLEVPKKRFVVVPQGQVLGPQLKKDAAIVTKRLESLNTGGNEASLAAFKQELEANGKVLLDFPAAFAKTVEESNRGAFATYNGAKAAWDASDKMQPAPKAPRDLNLPNGPIVIEASMVRFSEEVANVEDFTPYVIEPSFGISRILFAIVDQNFHMRAADEQAAVISFPAIVAPIKVGIFPLMAKKHFITYVEDLEKNVITKYTKHVDVSGVSIGRRYARADEVGVVLSVTVDYMTTGEPDNLTEKPGDGTLTLRERDSTEQIRVGRAVLLQTIEEYMEGRKTWAQLKREFPVAHEGVENKRIE